MLTIDEIKTHANNARDNYLQTQLQEILSLLDQVQELMGEPTSINTRSATRAETPNKKEVASPTKQPTKHKSLSNEGEYFMNQMELETQLDSGDISLSEYTKQLDALDD